MSLANKRTLGKVLRALQMLEERPELHPRMRWDRLYEMIAELGFVKPGSSQSPPMVSAFAPATLVIRNGTAPQRAVDSPQTPNLRRLLKKKRQRLFNDPLRGAQGQKKSQSAGKTKARPPKAALEPIFAKIAPMPNACHNAS